MDEALKLGDKVAIMKDETYNTINLSNCLRILHRAC